MKIITLLSILLITSASFGAESSYDQKKLEVSIQTRINTVQYIIETSLTDGLQT